MKIKSYEDLSEKKELLHRGSQSPHREPRKNPFKSFKSVQSVFPLFISLRLCGKNLRASLCKTSVNLRERKKITNKTNTKSQRDEKIIEKTYNQIIIKSRRDDIIITLRSLRLCVKKNQSSKRKSLPSASH